MLEKRILELLEKFNNGKTIPYADSFLQAIEKSKRNKYYKLREDSVDVYDEKFEIFGDLIDDSLKSSYNVSELLRLLVFEYSEQFKLNAQTEVNVLREVVKHLTNNHRTIFVSLENIKLSDMDRNNLTLQMLHIEEILSDIEYLSKLNK